MEASHDQGEGKGRGRRREEGMEGGIVWTGRGRGHVDETRNSVQGVRFSG